MAGIYRHRVLASLSAYFIFAPRMRDVRLIRRFSAASCAAATILKSGIEVASQSMATSHLRGLLVLLALLTMSCQGQRGHRGRHGYSG